MMASRRSQTDPTNAKGSPGGAKDAKGGAKGSPGGAKDAKAGAKDPATGGVQAHANDATKWWRIAVLFYVPALLLSVLGSILNWDAMVEALMSGETGTVAPTAEQARNFLIISTGTAVFMQGLVATVCWFLAGHLRRGSNAARMILSVAAGVFAVNALMSLVSMVGAGAEVGLLENAVTVLIATASAVAVYATVQAWRDGR